MYKISMKNYLFISLLGLMTIFTGCTEQTKKEEVQKKITEVGTFTINQQEIVLKRELPGRTVIALTSEIRPQVGGIIEDQLFIEGSTVKKGDILYKIDSSSYEATYNEAKAAYKNVLADVKAAQLKDSRYEELLKIDGVSKEDYEEMFMWHICKLSQVLTKKKPQCRVRKLIWNIQK